MRQTRCRDLLAIALAALLTAAAAPACRSSPASELAEARAAATRLTGEWRLVALDGAPLPAARPAAQVPTLSVYAAPAAVSQPRAGGWTGCNSWGASYQVEGAAGLRFGDLISTLAACADSLPAQTERRFVAALLATRHYVLRQDTLLLYGGRGTAAAAFVHAAAGAPGH